MEDGDPFEAVEFFSGVGRIASLAKASGYTSAALDISYGEQYAQQTGKRNPMDMNSDAGLALLAQWFHFLFTRMVKFVHACNGECPESDIIIGIRR